MFCTVISVALLANAATIAQANLAGPIRFQDETVSAGFGDQQDNFLNKFGGPMITDLNGDFFDDLVLCNHVNIMYVYHRVSDGTFEQVSTISSRDWHGISVDDINADGNQDLLTSIGGRSGRVPTAPRVLLFEESTNSYREINSARFQLDEERGRGRLTRFVDMDLDGDQDILVSNRANNGNLTTRMSDNWIYENLGNSLYRLYIPDVIESAPCGETALVTDFNDDQILDIVCATDRTITALQGTGTFPEPYLDVSDKWVPSVRQKFGLGEFTSATELDYDNDGLMDIFLTCGGSARRGSRVECNDVLLRNTGSSYVDVTREAAIPAGGNNKEPAVGDFNLDGHIDVFVPNGGLGIGTMLTNNGDGSFTSSTDHGIDPPAGNTGGCAGAGALVTQVRGGLLDIIAGYEPGAWRFYRNRTARQRQQFLTITLVDSPSARVRGAKVTVKAGNLTMSRRVGSSGSSHQNYQTTVHFGIATNTQVDSYEVRYVGGRTRIRRNVRRGRRFFPRRPT